MQEGELRLLDKVNEINDRLEIVAGTFIHSTVSDATKISLQSIVQHLAHIVMTYQDIKTNLRSFIIDLHNELADLANNFPSEKLAAQNKFVTIITKFRDKLLSKEYYSFTRSHAAKIQEIIRQLS